MERQAVVVDLPELRDRTRVFRDRREAGDVLAGLVGEALPAGTLVLGIPAGGLPVAAELARRLALPLDVAVVSKATPAWNTEVGYGAVAFDGTARVNERLVRALGLSPAEVEAGLEATRAKVARRVHLFRADSPLETAGRSCLLVDDGLASGTTMSVAVEALRRGGAAEVLVAVPTAHAEAAARLAALVDRLWVANVRGGRSFAVADAYRTWRDVPEEEALALLAPR